MNHSTPLLSVVINIIENYAIFRRMVDYLRKQTRHKEIEIVIVTTPQGLATIDEADFVPFHSYQMVRLENMLTVGVGFTAGITHARAAIVVMAEDHAYPNPQWAEALIAAHQQDYSAVGPAMANANPATRISWANFFLCFIEWFDPAAGHDVDALPGHNTSYKRDILMSFGQSLLPDLLSSERTLHYKLKERQYRLYLEPGAQIAHVNIAKFIPYLSHSFDGGRIFGNLRSRDWPLVKRLIYTIAAPLVPLVRLYRIHKALIRTKDDQHQLFWWTLGLLVLGLCTHAFGEVIGYLAGSGTAQARYLKYELHRRDYVRSDERHLLEL